MNETLKSSASSAEAGAAASAQDAKPAAASSTEATQGAKKPQISLKEHLFGPKTKDSSSTDADEDDTPSSEQSRKTDNGQTDPAKAKEGEAADPNLKPEEEPKPLTDEEEKKLEFHKHPRWRQMRKENAEIRGKITELEPKAKAFDDFVGKVSTAKLSGQDLDSLLDVGATLKSDPMKAYNYLVGYVRDLGLQLGVTLPPELAQRVKDGYLTEEDAQRLAKAEATQKLTEAAQNNQSAEDKQKQEHETKEAKKGALSQWEFAWKAKDPDYEKLQPEVEDRFLVLSRKTPPKTPEDIVTLAEQALKDVKKRRQDGLPFAQERKPPTQSGASVETKTEPKTMREAMKARASAGRK